METERGRVGRPRSVRAREAVLHAVDDLLVEQGYAAMTMKGIAERAGVSRQTVYRWWSTKAEILVEATVVDAAKELTVTPGGDPLADLTSYLDALAAFLSRSPAGLGYRAVVGEAQHDTDVAALLVTRDVLGDSARRVITRAVPGLDGAALDLAVARLVGPTFFAVTTGGERAVPDAQALARAFLGDVAHSGSD